jgi:hypothetical protein
VRKGVWGQGRNRPIPPILPQQHPNI